MGYIFVCSLQEIQRSWTDYGQADMPPDLKFLNGIIHQDCSFVSAHFRTIFQIHLLHSILASSNWLFSYSPIFSACGQVFSNHN